MMLKATLSLFVFLGLSACALTEEVKDNVPEVSNPTLVVKASLQPASKPVTAVAKAAQCDDKGFCPLPGLKRPKKAQ